jgi:DNA polymerase-1
MKLLPLIDADSIVYKAAFGCSDDLIRAIEYSNFLIDRCWDRFFTKPVLFLSGSSNFRYSIDKDYKGNRKAPRPPFYDAIREYMVLEWKAEISDGYEADDVVGTRVDPFSVICSIDKDMNTIPGFHYNYIKDEFYEVTEEEAAFYFWKQCLVGDTTDNVKGIKGIGEVKASKLLSGLSVSNMRKVVEDKYLSIYGGLEEFDRTARLIFIKRGKLTSEYTDYY